MQIEKDMIFDTTESLKEIDFVIQKEVNKLLKKFTKQFIVYEETHKSVMNIPSVKSLILNSDKVVYDIDSQDEVKDAKIKELEQKINSLMGEVEVLQLELLKHKSEEHISLKIDEKEIASSEADVEKQYEKITVPNETTTKKIILNNMFKINTEEAETEEDE